MTAQQKFRVDSFVSDKAIKAPCQAISVLNLTLYGEQTVNSVAVVAGDRVLVNAQTAVPENGIYNVEQTGWTRAADWDGDRDATAGTIVIVAGTPLISLYQLDVTGTFTIGTSDANFTLLATLDLAGNLASTSNGQGASLVAIEDAGGLIIATDVEAALAELVAAINTNASDIGDNATDIATNAAAIVAIDSTDTFVTDWTGFSTAEDSTWTYRKVGNIVTISAPQIGATSDATNFVSGATDVPAAIRPTTTKMGAYITRDNGTFILGTINVSSSGQISFGAANLSGLGGFTASGDKGFRGSQPFTYSMD